MNRVRQDELSSLRSVFEPSDAGATECRLRDFRIDKFDSSRSLPSDVSAMAPSSVTLDGGAAVDKKIRIGAENSCFRTVRWRNTNQTHFGDTIQAYLVRNLLRPFNFLPQLSTKSRGFP